jgi:hypothetical protein
MPRSQRAKQFAPFAALKGLEEALAEKEKLRVKKRELSEERKSEINDILKKIHRGVIVTAVYYGHIEQEYLQITGRVERLCEQRQRLFIGDTEISFDDLLEITI